MKIWDVGDRQYELVEGWGDLPEGWIWGEASGIAVDRDDNVHVYTREAPPYRIFDRSGKLLDCWGEGIFDGGHYVTVNPDNSVFFVDYDTHAILKFDHHGRHLMTLGNRWHHSDTGFDETKPRGDASTVNGVMYAGPPFHRPTDVIVAESGNIFVSDGYRNARVHKFSPDGVLIQSWGEPGDARDLRDTASRPGFFHNPHSISEHKDRIYVCDRENNRVQIFDAKGEPVDIWLGFKRPAKIFIAQEEEVAYIAEMHDRVSILDLDGNLIGRFGAERSHEPGKFWGPHGICKDSEESIYVSETLKGRRVQKFARIK